MYAFLLNIHSILAFLTIGLLLANVLNSAMGANGERPFQNSAAKVALFGLIFSHIQLLVGLVLYFQSPYFAALGQGMKEAMQDPMIRKMAIEHPFTNIIAIIFITMGHSTYKKLELDVAKFKRILIFYGAGLILLLSRIPYGQWFD
jgi:hypothetical protein